MRRVVAVLIAAAALAGAIYQHDSQPTFSASTNGCFVCHVRHR